MKLTIKTLKGEIFTVEAEAAQTIQDVKESIKAAKGFAVEGQKLVFKGKNTNNTDTLEALGIKEADFMVVMVAAKKAEEKPVEKKEETAPQKVEQPAAEQPKPAGEKPAPGGGMGLVSNEQYQASLTELTSMGFDRQTAVAAMKAAYNNVERAVEYCINGIPKRTAPPPAATGSEPAPGAGGEGAALDPSLLLGLMASPQFAQIRQLVRSNPAALPNILQSIATSSPQLFQIISQNPELFEQLLLGDDLPQIPQQAQQPGTIEITNEEKEAIERLASLGFPKIEAAQAYIACDKNEELAANLLFDRLANGDFEPEPEEQKGNQGGQNKDKKDEEDDNDNLFS